MGPVSDHHGENESSSVKRRISLKSTNWLLEQRAQNAFQAFESYRLRIFESVKQFFAKSLLHCIFVHQNHQGCWKGVDFLPSFFTCNMFVERCFGRIENNFFI